MTPVAPDAEQIGVPRLITLLGAESSGKTTLAAALAKALPAAFVPEALREFVVTHGRTPRQDEQVALMRAQIFAERQAAAAATAEGFASVVADPAALMTAIYSVAYFDDDSLLAEALEHQSHYALTIWCDIDLPWIADGDQRDGPDRRMQVHDLLADVIAERQLTVLKVSGSTPSRLDQVLAKLGSANAAFR